MYVVILILHILVALVMMTVVLMQSGKGRGLATTFGGGGNQTLFGGRGAVDFLGKATWVLGAAFMITSLTLALLTAKRTQQAGAGGSIIPKDAIPAGAPAVPGGGIPSEPTPTPEGSVPPAPTPGGN
jgi:preprotein translocase subunit SecG